MTPHARRPLASNFPHTLLHKSARPGALARFRALVAKTGPRTYSRGMKTIRRALISLLVGLLGRGAWAASPAPVAGDHGMVVTAQALATRVGVEVLKKGGNAVDAAVAVGYALAVVYPAAGNLGGGGFITLQLADGRKTFIDFRETAPLAATATMYLDPVGN